MVLKILFWLIIVVIFYTYLGYPLVLAIIVAFKKKTSNQNSLQHYPYVTLFVTAYNEEAWIDKKIKNSLELNYPKEKLHLVWVTDGSDDKTNELLAKYPEVKVYYEPERRGKINAMNRGMDFVDSEIVIFSDANTILSSDTIIEIVKTFQDINVGCIAGEKQILMTTKEGAASAGEGIYWKYESWLKNLDATIGSCVGAAGELFAIRRNLFFKVAPDTILDDFIISLTIAQKGYKIAYNPQAFAIEKASANVNEEMKRKIRIAAGSIQAIGRLKALLNPFRYKFLSVQYISHKVLRWVFVPPGMLAVLLLNIVIVYNQPQFQWSNIYFTIFLLQLLFYVLVFIGFWLKDRKVGFKFIFVPYYFFMANYAMYLGYQRYRKGNQSVNWERAQRAG